MATTFAKRLRVLFPDIDLSRQVELREDENGAVYIAKWNRAEPVPSNAQISAVTDQQVQDDIDARRTDLQNKASPLLRAIALVLLDEINILRTSAGLQPRTAQQLAAALKTKL